MTRKERHIEERIERLQWELHECPHDDTGKLELRGRISHARGELAQIQREANQHVCAACVRNTGCELHRRSIYIGPCPRNR